MDGVNRKVRRRPSRIFCPCEGTPATTFSFPGLGSDGPRNIAIALFSFPTVEAYESYRENVAKDPDCDAATKRFQQSRPFLSYERLFLEPVVR